MAAAWAPARLRASGICRARKKAESARSSCPYSFPRNIIPADSRPSRHFAGSITRCNSWQMNRDQVELARNADDIKRIRAQGKMAAVLDIEGSYDLDGDLGILRDLYRLGLRSAQLSAHNWDQNYADACCSPPKWGGLTAHGRDVIREMNRLGMVINVSHSSDDTTSQAIDVSDGPIIATHQGLRSVNDIPRNMPDWLLKKMAAKGGIIGFQIGSEFNYPKEYA